MPKSETISAKIPSDLVAALRDRATSEGISVSAWVARALSEALVGKPPVNRVNQLQERVTDDSVNQLVNQVDQLVNQVNQLQERVTELEANQGIPEGIPVQNSSKPAVYRGIPEADKVNLSPEQLSDALAELRQKIAGKAAIKVSAMARTAKKFSLTADQLAGVVGWVKTGKGDRAEYVPGDGGTGLNLAGLNLD